MLVVKALTDRCVVRSPRSTRALAAPRWWSTPWTLLPTRAHAPSVTTQCFTHAVGGCSDCALAGWVAEPAGRDAPIGNWGSGREGNAGAKKAPGPQAPDTVNNPGAAAEGAGNLASHTAS